MPNLIYTLDPAQITVTNSFVENVMKLEAVGISANNIIDIYLEAQKYAESIPGLTNPMRYIQACENQTTEKAAVKHGVRRHINAG